MVKRRENQPEATADAQQPSAPATPTAAALPVVTDTIDAAAELFVARSEIERLRAENEILKRKQLAAVGLDATRGKKKIYRVALDGMRTCKSARCISPRITAPPHLQQLPAISFDDLDLFLNEAEYDPAKLFDAAWQRYCRQAHPVEQSDATGATHVRAIDPIRDRRSFMVAPQHQGPPVDYLDIPAHSPADAFGLFCKFNGVTATARAPSVQEIGEAPEAVAA